MFSYLDITGIMEEISYEKKLIDEFHNESTTRIEACKFVVLLTYSLIFGLDQNGIQSANKGKIKRRNFQSLCLTFFFFEFLELSRRKEK
jgi:hypothetical protein